MHRRRSASPPFGQPQSFVAAALAWQGGRTRHRVSRAPYGTSNRADIYPAMKTMSHSAINCCNTDYFARR